MMDMKRGSARLGGISLRVGNATGNQVTAFLIFPPKIDALKIGIKNSMST